MPTERPARAPSVLVALVGAWALVACAAPSHPGHVATADSGPDASVDASPDAAIDVASEVASDASPPAPSPDVAWSTVIGGPFGDVPAGVGVDARGRAWVAGSYQADARVGDADGALPDADATDDVFLVGLEPDGALVRAQAIVRSVGNASYAYAHGLAVASDGAAVVVGGLIGEGTFAEQGTRTAAGAADAFVAWIDRDGRVERARIFGGAADGCGFKQDCERADAVSIDASGGLAVATTLRGSVSLEPTATPPVGVSAPLSGAPVLLRLRPDGVVVFARALPEVTGAIQVAALDDGGALVTGGFSGTWTPAGLPAITADGQGDAFLLRLDATGAPRWLVRGGAAGVGDERGLQVRARADGSAVVAGVFVGTATFGAGTPTETVLHSAGDADVFVARFDEQGGLVWARGCGGARSDGLMLQLAIDVDGAAAVAGLFLGEASFGGGAPGAVTLPAGSWAAAARWSASGALAWAGALTGPDQGMIAQGLALAPGGRLVLGARLTGAVDLGRQRLRLTPRGTDALLAALDP